MSYEEQLFDEVIYDAAEELSPSDATDLREWVESLECAKRKADEYEAKAKAFDFIREARKEVLTDVRERGVKLPADLDKFSMMTEHIINKYESGEYDAEKR